MSFDSAVLDFVQIATALAATGAAIAAFWQSRMTKDQLDNTMRPWVSMDYAGIGVTPDKVITMQLKNYGQVPAKNLRVKLFSNDKPFSETELAAREYTHGHSVIAPNGTRRATISLHPQTLPLVVAGTIDIFVGVWAEYEYAKDKKGEYLLIGKYNFGTGYDETVTEIVR